MLRSWSYLKEDAHKGVYESLCMRVRDAEREAVWLKGQVAVHCSKRERAEAVLGGLVSWVSKLSGILKGELIFLGLCVLSFHWRLLKDLCFFF